MKKFNVGERYRVDDKEHGYKPEMQKIEVGDTVKVVNILHTFLNSHKEILGEYYRNFVIGSLPKLKELYKVLNVKSYIVLIQNQQTTQVFIVGIEGLRKVEK